MPSYKTEVVERLFDARWRRSGRPLSSHIVTLEDVQAGIRAYNARHGTTWSDRNPPNFFKDFIRNRRRGNAWWPSSVLRRGYTGRQVTGDGLAFEFVLLGEGQTEAFSSERIPPPAEATPRHKIQSVSLPLTSRELGREEETWLMQVLVRLHVIETHLSIYSPQHFEQVDHLQMSMKLRRAEVDSVYLGLDRRPDGVRTTLIACEAKGHSDDILEDQMIAQVKALARLEINFDEMLPIAAKVVRGEGIHVVEFATVERTNVEALEALTVVSQAVYQLLPPVPGIR
jgi:hypothetical protein